MANSKDLVGQRFGRLVVIKRLPSVRTGNSVRSNWFCQCDCGNTHKVTTKELTSGHVCSCGCYHKEVSSKVATRTNTTHNLTKEEYNLYSRWKAIKQRCYNPNNIAYKNYGGRGIKMCDEWYNDPRKFVEWCKDNGIKQGFDIDRIDVNGDYEPSNCRSLTRSENSKNKRNVILVSVNGIKKTMSEWNRIVGYAHSSLQRLYRRCGENAVVERIESLLSKKGIVYA